jgi:hypothetical protein
MQGIFPKNPLDFLEFFSTTLYRNSEEKKYMCHGEG